MATTFSHDAAERLFVVDVDGIQGTVLYQEAGPRVLDFQSTYIPAALRKRGIGTQLVHYALDWAREHGYRVIPSCWFTREIMERDSAYRDLRADG